MKIEYLHASKFGNGAMVAAEFKKLMAAKGVSVDVHHIREVSPAELSSADLYVFSSPGRMGKPIGRMRRFLKKVRLPAGTKYAVLTTEAAPKPDKKTGRMPTEEELAKWQRVRPIMNEILQGKGLGQGRGRQGLRDRSQRPVGRGLAPEGRGVRGQAPHTQRGSDCRIRGIAPQLPIGTYVPFRVLIGQSAVATGHGESCGVQPQVWHSVGNTRPSTSEAEEGHRGPQPAGPRGVGSRRDGVILGRGVALGASHRSVEAAASRLGRFDKPRPRSDEHAPSTEPVPQPVEGLALVELAGHGSSHPRAQPTAHWRRTSARRARSRPREPGRGPRRRSSRHRRAGVGRS